MIALWILPIVVQAVAMLADEGHYHHRRGLPRWERLGHPLDTLTIAMCLGWLVVAPPGTDLDGYVALAVGSTLFVTKDEVVHARLCDGGEQWLHAILFVVHPIVLLAYAQLWRAGHAPLLAGQLVLTLAFATYQLVYWNWLRDRAPRAPRVINNGWYADLGDRWYRAQDTPIALLRAEARHRNPWIARTIARALGLRPCRVLDLGCGAGFLTNDLAVRGHEVTGLDADPQSLEVAARHDTSGRVRYVTGDACALDFPDGSFDVVCAMDLLEHVATPEALIAEAGRVLAPGGLFFFHTFNRTWQANLIVIKGVELFVANTPPNLHVLRLFRTPAEVAAMCGAAGLGPVELRGSRPRFGWPLWRMLVTGKVGEDFAFTFTSSTRLGFTGVARRVDCVRGGYDGSQLPGPGR